jgi:hypothetical protein
MEKMNLRIYDELGNYAQVLNVIRQNLLMTNNMEEKIK